MPTAACAAKHDRRRRPFGQNAPRARVLGTAEPASGKAATIAVACVISLFRDYHSDRNSGPRASSHVLELLQSAVCLLRKNAMERFAGLAGRCGTFRNSHVHNVCVAGFRRTAALQPLEVDLPASAGVAKSLQCAVFGASPQDSPARGKPLPVTNATGPGRRN